jgi:hypothetical protein
MMVKTLTSKTIKLEMEWPDTDKVEAKTQCKQQGVNLAGKQLEVVVLCGNSEWNKVCLRVIRGDVSEGKHTT